MGFLQKGWNWEQTDPVQGEEKPVESRKWLWALSLFAFALSMFVLYHVEHTLYGGIIETNALVYGSAMVGIISNIYEEPPEQRQKWERARTFVFRGILLLGVAVVLYALATMERRIFLMALQMISLLPVYLVLRKKNEQFQKERDVVILWSVFFISVLLAAATLVAPHVMGITATVQEAQKKLAAEGFTEVSYVGHDSPVYPLIPKDVRMELEEEELSFDLYLFEMRKDSIPWGAMVNPMTGEVLGSNALTEDTTLSRTVEWEKGK